MGLDSLTTCARTNKLIFEDERSLLAIILIISKHFFKKKNH